MTPEQALTALKNAGTAENAKAQAAYHKNLRQHLGVRNPDIDQMARQWRADLSMPDRLHLADGLWQSNIHEARVAAAKLLTQARIKTHESEAWALIASWTPEFDAWAIADHVSSAASRRLTAHPDRLDEVEEWTKSNHMWTRRAALVSTLPWGKQRHPSEDEAAARERILGWAALYVDDKQWFIQKAVAWWLRDLSKRAPDRVKTFLDQHGENMKNFARKEAGKYL
ncbi:MAG: DNA alkylation repair protein [Pikeienuella sp.]